MFRTSRLSSFGPGIIALFVVEISQQQPCPGIFRVQLQGAHGVGFGQRDIAAFLNEPWPLKIEPWSESGSSSES